MEEEDVYVSESKQNIDRYIRKKEYRKAFGLLILVLERLDDTQKGTLIDYYSKNMSTIAILTYGYPSRL